MYIELPSRFWSPRTKPVRFIVLHTTQGTDSRTWLTETGNVSSHYLVRGETVYRLVSEDRVAWHAGIIVGDPTTNLYDPEVNPNEESVGIEVEGYAADRLPDNAIRATGALIRDIWTRHRVPLVAHAHLSPGNRSDPGAENYARMVAAATEEEMTAEEREREFVTLTQKHITPTIVAMKAAYDPLVDAARQNGLVDEAQEQALVDVRTRLDRIAEAARR